MIMIYISGTGTNPPKSGNILKPTQPPEITLVYVFLHVLKQVCAAAQLMRVYMSGARSPSILMINCAI